MATLTRAESNKINSATTVDYATQELFEDALRLASAEAIDIGGLVVYFNDNELIAFYDYDRELGALLV